MAITVRIDEQKSEATLIVTERFTFEQHKAFTEAYRKLSRRFLHYVLDLYRVEYMDSAALGMLLKLREHLDGSGGEITILTKPGAVLNVLRISRFDFLFNLKAG